MHGGPTAPWSNRDYLEKAIFVYALAAVSHEFDLHMQELLAYYNVDVPKSLIAERSVSLPIYMDIHNHLVAAVGTGEAQFSNMSKLEQRFRETIPEEFRNLLSRPTKKWWQFWR